MGHTGGDAVLPGPAPAVPPLQSWGLTHLPPLRRVLRVAGSVQGKSWEVTSDQTPIHARNHWPLHLVLHSGWKPSLPPTASAGTGRA